MTVDRISHLLKLLSNQVMVAIPMNGKTRPPGALKVFSDACCCFLLNLIVDKITARYISRMAALANMANCLNPPETEKRKMSAP